MSKWPKHPLLYESNTRGRLGKFARIYGCPVACWDLEGELQQRGFGFCYDKRLSNRLARDNAESVRLPLLADRSYQEKHVCFIENHDEPRAAAAFRPSQHRVAAVAVCTQSEAMSEAA